MGTCQKCYKQGHWTFQCTEQKQYLYRPSLTQQVKNPALKRKEIFDKVAKERGITDGDRRRDTRPPPSSSSSDSSDLSEADHLQKELEALIAKHKKLDQGLSDSSYSSSSSSSSSSLIENSSHSDNKGQVRRRKPRYSSSDSGDSRRRNHRRRRSPSPDNQPRKKAAP